MSFYLSCDVTPDIELRVLQNKFLLYFIALYYIALHFIALHSISLDCIALYDSVLQSQQYSILIKYDRFSRHVVTSGLDCNVSIIY